MFAGYDAQRVVDDGPWVSSPAAQHLAAAALFFCQDAVAGGPSGYLVSDASKHWLTGSEAKRLTGEPVDAPAPLRSLRAGEFRAPGNESTSPLINPL